MFSARKQISTLFNNKLRYLLALAILFHHVHCQGLSAFSPSTGDDTCTIDGTTTTTERVQVAYVVDNTDMPKEYVQQLPEISERLHKRLNALNQGTEFAITTFGDYEKSVYGAAQGHDDP